MVLSDDGYCGQGVDSFDGEGRAWSYCHRGTKGCGQIEVTLLHVTSGRAYLESVSGGLGLFGIDSLNIDQHFVVVFPVSFDNRISEYHEGSGAAFIVAFQRHFNSTRDGRFGEPAALRVDLVPSWPTYKAPRLFLLIFQWVTVAACFVLSMTSEACGKLGDVHFWRIVSSPLPRRQSFEQPFLLLSASPPTSRPALPPTACSTADITVDISATTYRAAVADPQSPSLCLAPKNNARWQMDGLECSSEMGMNSV